MSRNSDVASRGESFGEDEIVCPWCGYEHTDSWEVRGDSGEFDCHECERRFTFTRDTHITYSTSRGVKP